MSVKLIIINIFFQSETIVKQPVCRLSKYVICDILTDNIVNKMDCNSQVY